MGKVYSRVGGRDNHIRQRQLVTMALFGWVPVKGGVKHPDHGWIGKDTTGYFLRTYGVAPKEVPWDELTTMRVFWLYKQLTTRRWI